MKAERTKACGLQPVPVCVPAARRVKSGIIGQDGFIRFLISLPLPAKGLQPSGIARRAMIGTSKYPALVDLPDALVSFR
jgi:hypothetical protein